MKHDMPVMKSLAKRFRQEEDGVVTVSFVLVFPVFMFFFYATYETGMVNLRHVMLERGVDLAVREVRIGSMNNPTADRLRERICDIAGVIPDCENQLRVEMLRRDLRAAWVPISSAAQCVNRAEPVQLPEEFNTFGDNELMFLRVCARIDPVLPGARLGRKIKEIDSSAAAGGSFALISSAAFVVEPFQGI